MDGYNIKNYTEPGGDVTHIGGKLIFEEGAEVEGLPLSGSAEEIKESTATTVAALRDDFNSLLKNLKAAGMMKAGD